ncbi:MAG: DUF5071 domain-containing protein [Planctomycetota bacterium]
MPDDLHSLLPKHRSDVFAAKEVLAFGYPTIAPVLPDLLEWLKDMNWPVSHPISEFLASIPEPMAPLIQNVLRGEDLIWKYNCISQLISEMPVELAEQFRKELIRLANTPTTAECEEHLNEAALDAMYALWPSDDK